MRCNIIFRGLSFGLIEDDLHEVRPPLLLLLLVALLLLFTSDGAEATDASHFTEFDIEEHEFC